MGQRSYAVSSITTYLPDLANEKVWRITKDKHFHYPTIVRSGYKGALEEMKNLCLIAAEEIIIRNGKDSLTAPSEIISVSKWMAEVSLNSDKASFFITETGY